MGCRGCDGNYCRICANPAHNAWFWTSVSIFACMAFAIGLIAFGIYIAIGG
jgi:hypothetical protein